jgi:hypothetical protein
MGQEVEVFIGLPTIRFEAQRPRIICDCRCRRGCIIDGQRAVYSENGCETNRDMRKILCDHKLTFLVFLLYPHLFCLP